MGERVPLDVFVSTYTHRAASKCPAESVGMVKAVNEFYKTGEVNAKLQNIYGGIQAGLKEREAKRNQIMEELQKLDKEMRDPVLNEASRGKKQAEADQNDNQLPLRRQGLRNRGAGRVYIGTDFE